MLKFQEVDSAMLLSLIIEFQLINQVIYIYLITKFYEVLFGAEWDTYLFYI